MGSGCTKMGRHREEKVVFVTAIPFLLFPLG
jgi:hypothetical protein